MVVSHRLLLGSSSTEALIHNFLSFFLDKGLNFKGPSQTASVAVCDQERSETRLMWFHSFKPSKTPLSLPDWPDKNAPNSSATRSFISSADVEITSSIKRDFELQRTGWRGASIRSSNYWKTENKNAAWINLSSSRHLRMAEDGCFSRLIVMQKNIHWHWEAQLWFHLRTASWVNVDVHTVKYPAAVFVIVHWKRTYYFRLRLFKETTWKQHLDGICAFGQRYISVC